MPVPDVPSSVPVGSPTEFPDRPATQVSTGPDLFGAHLQTQSGWAGELFCRRKLQLVTRPALPLRPIVPCTTWSRRGGWHGDDSLGACHAPRSLGMVLVNHGARWGPDANRHSGKETAPSRYVDLFHHVCHCRARLPGHLASCGGDISALATDGHPVAEPGEGQLREPLASSLHAGGNGRVI